MQLYLTLHSSQYVQVPSKVTFNVPPTIRVFGNLTPRTKQWSNKIFIRFLLLSCSAVLAECVRRHESVNHGVISSLREPTLWNLQWNNRDSAALKNFLLMKNVWGLGLHISSMKSVIADIISCLSTP